MINLWAQREVDDEEKPEVVNPLSKRASPETSKPAIGSKQKVAAKRNTEGPLVKDQLGEIALPAESAGNLATPFNQALKIAAGAVKVDQLSEIAPPAFPLEAWTLGSSSPPHRVTQAPKSKLKLFQHLPDTCDSKLKLSKHAPDSTCNSTVGGQQLSDPVAECCRRIALFQAEIQKIEQALDKTKRDLDRNEQEMTLYGEGPPNLNGDTLEDLDMRLQLSQLEQMRELAEHSEAMRTCQISLYKLCYDAEAFPSISDAVSPEHILQKKPCDTGSMKHRGIALAKERRASMRDLATSPSQTW